MRWQHPRARPDRRPRTSSRSAEESGLIESRSGAGCSSNACRQAAEWHAAQPGRVPRRHVGQPVRRARWPSRTCRRCVGEIAHLPGPRAVTLLASRSRRAPWSRIREHRSRTLTALTRDGCAARDRRLRDGLLVARPTCGAFRSTRLKIDRSFVEGLGVERDSAAIVDALVAMAGALSLGVTAEGVETATQVEELKRLGCRHAQGFFFSTPLPAPRAGADGRRLLRTRGRRLRRCCRRVEHERSVVVGVVQLAYARASRCRWHRRRSRPCRTRRRRRGPGSERHVHRPAALAGSDPELAACRRCRSRTRDRRPRARPHSRAAPERRGRRLCCGRSRPRPGPGGRACRDATDAALGWRAIARLPAP